VTTDIYFSLSGVDDYSVSTEALRDNNKYRNAAPALLVI